MDIMDALTHDGSLFLQLKAHEGVRTHAYRCSAGKLTIGVGRNIDADGGIGLNEIEINLLLVVDVERCTEELFTHLPWTMKLDTVRREAMINLCFNLGITKLKQFKRALTYMEAGDYLKAADEFLDSRWAKQVGYRADEIATQIRTGAYSSRYL